MGDSYASMASKWSVRCPGVAAGEDRGPGAPYSFLDLLISDCGEASGTWAVSEGSRATAAPSQGQDAAGGRPGRGPGDASAAGHLVDVRDDTTAADGGLDEGVELLITADGKLQVARRDTLHLEVLRAAPGGAAEVARAHGAAGTPQA